MRRIFLYFIMAVFSAASAMAQFADVAVNTPDVNLGIKVAHQNGDTVRITPITYEKMKAGTGSFLSGMTYGITKTKSKNVYKGKHSVNQLKVGDKFIFMFGEVPEAYEDVYGAFSPSHSIRNFTLCKMDVKKKTRELTTMESNLWSSSDIGAKANEDVKFEVTSPAVGVYEATITEAKPGEYCFIFNDAGAVSAFLGVFDFGIAE